MPVSVRKTRGYSLGIISDPHASVSGYLENEITAISWLLSTGGSSLFAVAVTGDLEVGPAEHQVGDEWLVDPEGGNIPTSMTLIPVIGNHDAEIDWQGAYNSTPSKPHSTIVGTYPGMFKGREWYTYDHESTRLIIINNNSDYIQGTGNSAYYNCNPPGTQTELNPDHSGITVVGSEQRTWLNRVSASDHLWKIVMGHRSFVAPYDTDPRKLNREGWVAMATPIDNGVSLLSTGDIHVGSFSGPWYPAGSDGGTDDFTKKDPGAVGAYSLTLAGGYVGRAVDDTVLPDHATNCLWGSGGTGVAHAALLSFEGDQAYLQVFECSQADPTGAVVFTHTLIRNPGA